MNHAPKRQPPPASKPESRRGSAHTARRILRALSAMIAVVLLVTFIIGFYIVTAPDVEVSKELPRLYFQGRSALRKRPSLDSAPIAYAQQGTKLEILSTEGDWTQVRIEGAINGWTQSDQGTVTPPPPPLITSRQRAKQRLYNLANRLRDVF